MHRTGVLRAHGRRIALNRIAVELLLTAQRAEEKRFSAPLAPAGRLRRIYGHSTDRIFLHFKNNA
jgi:hypothetical protein